MCYIESDQEYFATDSDSERWYEEMEYNIWRILNALMNTIFTHITIVFIKMFPMTIITDDFNLLGILSYITFILFLIC